MANLICAMSDCKHRSKRPLKKWKHKDGSKCYSCLLRYTVITEVFDADGDIEAVAGRENIAHCINYEPEQAEGENNAENED